MYLRDKYFQELGRWPTVDLNGGYFTILQPIDPESVDPLLRHEIARLPLASSSQFTFMDMGEETYNGWINTGSSGNRIELAWCEAAGVGAILYRGEGIPSRLKWFDGETPQEIVDQWCEEYVVPVSAIEGEDGSE